MKFKWLFLAWLLLPITAQAENLCAPTPNYESITTRAPHALLYEIRRCGKPRSYVLGTFHSDSPEINPLYQLAISRLQHSKQLALEVVLTDDIREKVRRTLNTSSSVPNLSARIGKEKFKIVKDKLLPRLQMKLAEVERYKPWAVAVLSQYPKAEQDGVVLDEKLQHYAESWGMKVIGLETAPSQLAIFDRMKETLQMDFLNSTLEDADILDDQHTELKGYYLARDLGAIYDMSERLFTKMHERYPALSDYLKDQVLTRRNKSMTQRMLPLFQTSTFVAIGALHLPGPHGVLHQLEESGYEIWPVTEAEKPSR